MDIDIESGTYVVAVSGGVDSVVLLDILQKLSNLELIVAHFDHGIRKDSERDRVLVEKLAKKYDLPFVSDFGRLGPQASEASAREARYQFLTAILSEINGRAIITAHHQDDVMETALINIIRGTGRKGLTALSDRPDIRRPLLKFTKRDITEYAQKNKLKWNEDFTNTQDKYLRNYIRKFVVPKMDYRERKKMIKIIEDTRFINRELEHLLQENIKGSSGSYKYLDRDWFIQLPHDVAKEIMADWLRVNDLRGFNSKTLERLVVASKVSKPGLTYDVMNNVRLNIQENRLALIRNEC